jgi:transposase
LELPLPEVIGIDEHSFRREKKSRETIWNTVLVDHINGRVYDLFQGRKTEELLPQMRNLPGAEKVKFVTLDLSESFRNTAQILFPNAELVADRFHVLRCIDERLKEELKTLHSEIRRKNKEKERLLFCGATRLSRRSRESLNPWLLGYYCLSKLYGIKQSMLEILIRNSSYEKRRDKFAGLLTQMGKLQEQRIQSLRGTFLKWKKEILCAMRVKWSNGRTEGFNTKAKLVKREAHGFKNWENFRLKFWYACFGQYT